MQTKAEVKRHPVHPMLIPLPIGLLLFSLVADIVARAGGNPAWDDVALYTMGGGIVGALLAAIPGFVDWWFLPEKSRSHRIGIWHLSLNLVVVVLYAVNFWMRVETAAESVPFALSIIAVLILGVSGWLGGEMVYVEAVAVDCRLEGRIEADISR